MPKLKKRKEEKDTEETISEEIEKEIDDIEIQEIKPEIIESPSQLSWFTTGSIPLNLACSQLGKNGGIPRGRITNFVGDGSSGKTIFALEVCANAFYSNPHSNHYPDTKKIIIHYNNPEEVMDFNVDLMYGEKFNQSVVWKDIPTVEETGYDIAKVLKNKKKDEGIIYVVDSWDALKSEKLYEEFDKIVDGKASKKGSYDLDKQKFGTREFFPNICKLMSDIDFTLIIISQTRDKIGGLFPEKTRSGGSALNFYTHNVVWLSESDKLEKTVDGQKLVRGIKTKAKIKRSKVSKPYREAETVITFDYGVDNIGSCLNYLVGYAESYSADLISEKLNINRDILPDKKINRSQLTKLIESESLEETVYDSVERIWKMREEALHEPRKSKF